MALASKLFPSYSKEGQCVQVMQISCCTEQQNDLLLAFFQKLFCRYHLRVIFRSMSVDPIKPRWCFIINGKSCTCLFGQGLIHRTTLSVTLSCFLSCTWRHHDAFLSISNIRKSEHSCGAFDLIRSTSCRRLLAAWQLFQKTCDNCLEMRLQTLSIL